MSAKYHGEIIQGTDEWLALRQGILTASEMKLIITPTLATAKNDKSRAHVYEIASQRISGYTEPQYISDDMLRGMDDEITARDLYSKHYAPVAEVGFITSDELGFTIGYSPDGLVGDNGLIEIKSRRQKYQVQTIIENAVPADYVIQIQTGLMVSGRKWCDFISYSGGLGMVVIRMHPDSKIQDAIKAAAVEFEAQVQAVVEKYRLLAAALIPTVRRVEQEITL